MNKKQDNHQMYELINSVRDAIQKGDMNNAFNHAAKAFELDPNNPEALDYLTRTTRALYASTAEISYKPIDLIPGVITGPPGLLDPPHIYELETAQDEVPSDALYYSISGGDLGPSWGPREYSPWYIYGSQARFGQGEYGGSMFAGVHLPHGAFIWGWRVYARRNPNANTVTRIIANLYEYGPSNNSGMRIGQTQTAIFDPGSSYELKEISVSSLNHEINNSSKTYYLDIACGGDGFQRSMFTGAIIIYTASGT